MQGRTNNNIKIIRPLVDGVIADLNTVVDFLKKIFEKTMHIWKNAIIVLACPSNITDIEKQALKEVAYKMGAKNVIIEEEIKMAAIGADINIKLPIANLLVDIGAGTTDIAVIASGDVIVSKSIKLAGNYLDEEINKYLRLKHKILIGITSAIKLKHEINLLNDQQITTVYGSNIKNKLPKQIKIKYNDIKPIILTLFEKIHEAIIDVLREIHAELAADILNNGITITGGGALLKDITTFFNKKFNLNVKVAHEPLHCVIEGIKKLEKEITKK